MRRSRPALPLTAGLALVSLGLLGPAHAEPVVGAPTAMPAPPTGCDGNPYVATGGDVNGDGHDDAAVTYVSVPATGDDCYNDNVHVWYGATDGVSGDPDLTLGEPTTVPYRLMGADATMRGDFDGDGFGDLLVSSVINMDIANVYVFPGSAAGLATTPSVHLQRDPGEYFGSAVRAADFDGDGYDDAAIATSLAASYRGVVEVFHGSSAGLESEPRRRWRGAQPNDTLGSNMATGDVNGDGYADLLVAAPDALASRGQVYVHHGSADGLEEAPALTLTGTDLPGALGYGLSVGDVDADGYDDALVGAWLAGGDNAGKATLYYGSPAGLDPTTADAIPSPAAAGQRFFGIRLLLADTDGDGHADAFVSQYDLMSTQAVFVYAGATTGLAGPPTRLTSPAGESYFGKELEAVGDLDADGLVDVAVVTYERALLYRGVRDTGEDTETGGTETGGGDTGETGEGETGTGGDDTGVPVDTDPGDTDPADTDPADTDPADTGAPARSGDEPGGCGCGHAGGGASALALLLAAGSLARRRGRS